MKAIACELHVEADLLFRRSDAKIAIMSTKGGAVRRTPAEKRARLDSLLKKSIDQLYSLSHQFAFQRRFEVELRAVTRGKAFRIRNLDLWNLLVNARDGLAVHIVSWATSLYEESGVFGTITSEGLNEALALGSKRDGRPKEKWEQEWMHGKRCQLFKRVFPRARKTDHGLIPSSADVTDLRNRFAARFKPLDADRNCYRAHAYEKQSSIGTVMRIHSPRRAQTLKYAQRLLRWLSVLCTRGDHHLPSVDELLTMGA